MNVREMIIEVQQQLQKQGAARTRKIFDEEVVWVLNKAQLKFRDSKIRRKSDDSGKYEIDQLHLDALRVWVVSNHSLTSITQLNPRATQGTLPDNYAYLLEDSSTVVDTCNSLFLFPPVNRMVRHDLVRKMLKTPYYSTKPDSPLSTMENTKIIVYNDGNFTVNGIIIDYIRKPSEISLTLFNEDPETGNCELPEEFHQEVVDISVELMLVDLGAPNVQQKVQQNQLIG